MKKLLHVMPILVTFLGLSSCAFFEMEDNKLEN